MSSQLQVLLLGSERQVIDTGNALLGREAFSPSEILQKQQERFNLPDGRLLLLTAAYRLIGLDLLTAPTPLVGLSEELEERVSQITSPAYHAVIIILEINSDLSLDFSLKAKWMKLHDSLSDFVKGKGVIVVTQAERFRDARNKGKIEMSFIEWMRKQGKVYRTLLQAMQERCILFDNAGSEDVLNTQRDELIHMIDSRVLEGAHYTDMKFKEAGLLPKKLEEDLEELKQQVQKKTTSLEEIEKRNSQKTDRSLKDMNNQIDELRERMKSLASSYHTSRIRKLLFILILLFLLLLPLLSSLWPVTSNSLKEITALDVRSDLRSYVDLKLEQAVKRIQENEKHLFGLNKTDLNNVSKIRQEMTEQFTELKERLLNETDPNYVSKIRQEMTKQFTQLKKRLLNETDPNYVSKIRQEMTEQFTQLKERLLNETADLTEDIKKNITSKILVLDMIESLPLFLPLIMVLTLLVLLLTPVQLPVPWAWLLAALLAALLILLFLLLLVLLGA